MIHQWKELLPEGGVMYWRMEEKENGDQHFTASVDIRIAIAPLPAGNTTAQLYNFVAAWPVDPNAPVIDDEDDDWEEEF